MTIDTNAVLTIFSLLSALLVVVNIYTLTVKKPQETQQTGLREVEKSFNEFIATYSGEYAGLKVKYDNLSKEVAEIKLEQKNQNNAIDEIARDLLKHELTEDTKEREVK